MCVGKQPGHVSLSLSYLLGWIIYVRLNSKTWPTSSSMWIFLSFSFDAGIYRELEFFCEGESVSLIGFESVKRDYFPVEFVCDVT